MKTKLTIAVLTALMLLCSCKQNKDNDNTEHIINDGGCPKIVKPANLRPIDWNGWNDAYTVGYTFHDYEENVDFSVEGDTINCYGHISRVLYEYYTELNPDAISLEGSENMEHQEWVQIFFGPTLMQNSIERDSLLRILNNSSHSDTCFVKGNLGLYSNMILSCYIVFPYIIVNRLEDIYFK